METKKRQFILNLFSSYGSSLITAVLSFISVPIALNYWGREIYGIWTILTSFSTYIMASGLGIDTSTGILMTKNSKLEIKISILKKGIRLLVLCSVIMGILLILITCLFPDWMKIIGKMDESNYPIAKISGLLFIAGIIINLPLSAVANSFQAFGRAYMNTLLGMIQVIMNFAIIIITALCKLSLPFYILLTIINTFCCNLIKLLYLIFLIQKLLRNPNQEKSIINNSDSEIDNKYSTILKTGINMSLYGLAIMLVPNFSNLIISNNVDVSSLVPYSMAYKLYITVIFFATNTNVALAPLMGQEYGHGNWEWLQKNYKRMFYTSISFSIFLIFGVIWFSKPFIYLWTGSINNYPGKAIIILLGIYFFVYVMNNLNLVVINSFNYTNKVWLISWAEGCVFLVSSLFLVKKIGVVGTPIGLCMGIIFISSWLYPLWVYKKTEKRFIYDFIFLSKYLAIFIFGIIVYIIFNSFNLSLLLQLLVDFIGFCICVLLLLIFLPQEIKQPLLSKLKKKEIK